MSPDLLFAFALLLPTTSQQPASPPTPPPAAASVPAEALPPEPVKISAGVLDKFAVRKPLPYYPMVAIQQHLAGAVVLRVLVDQNGRIVKAVAMSGPEILRKQAIDAVKKWEYKP